MTMDFCKNLQEITEGAVSNSSIIAGLDGPAADSNSSYDQPASRKFPAVYRFPTIHHWAPARYHLEASQRLSMAKDQLRAKARGKQKN